ncbi:helix-turn-helix domain-containing protein [Corallococcus sp. CA054B]|uniref:helix-turn-helix domain-containing protein n=1 Tax=Corallococcus sp. CA054B TaxID=2316734 RepID=UPI00351A9A6B
MRDVATRLAVSTATVYRLCKQGQLRSIRVSGAVRVDPTSVATFVALGGKTPTTS